MFEEFNKYDEALLKRDFEDTLSFKRACNFVEEAALHDNRLSKDVLKTYDKLLKYDLPEEVNNAICYNLGEMLSFQPELKNDVKNIVIKHQPKIDAFLQNNSTPYNEELASLSEEVTKDREQRDVLIHQGMEKIKNKKLHYAKAPEKQEPLTSTLTPILTGSMNNKLSR